ncbi:biotin--[acetyl-CoA-carboxylase] ligase [soil metagenome]
MVTAMQGERATPDLSRRARDLLTGSRFADVRWAATTGSTNADAMDLARAGAPEGVVLVADHQVAGRGRRGRTWTAPPRASLLVTVLLRPPAAVADATTMAVAVAAAEAVEQVAGFAPGLKWPNDLVFDGRKLAGILAEAEWPTGGDTGDRAVVAVGMGLNVNWPAELPDELRDTLVAVNHVTGAPVDRVALLVAFLRCLDLRYAALLDGDGDRETVVAAWRARSATLGRRVRVDLGAHDVVGTAVDVTPDGHLVVDTDDGERRTLAVGDVVHLRNA